MSAWGPADWAAVGAAAVFMVGLALRLAAVVLEMSWRDIWPKRRPPADPRDRLPYRRPS